MALDIKIDNFYKYVYDNKLKIKDISLVTGFNKGNLSKILNKKIHPPETFLIAFEDKYNVDLLLYVDVKKIRLDLGLDIYDFSKLTGINVNDLESWENNHKSPDANSSYKILKAANLYGYSDVISKVELIKSLSKKNNISTYKLAKNTGFSHTGVAKIINGTSKKPHLSTINILLKYLKDIENNKKSMPISDNILSNSMIVKNDSMDNGLINDTPNGAQIFYERFEIKYLSKESIQSKYGWVLKLDSGMLFKDISSIDNSLKELTLSSRKKSPEYQDFIIKIDDILDFFIVIKRLF